MLSALVKRWKVKLRRSFRPPALYLFVCLFSFAKCAPRPVFIRMRDVVVPLSLRRVIAPDRWP